MTTSDISSKTFVDAVGRQYTEPANVPGSRNFGMGFYISRKLLPIDIEFGFNGGITINSNHAFVNQDISDNHLFSASAGLFARKSISGHLEFDVRSNVGFSSNENSINTAGNTNLWQQNQFFRGSLYLFPTFEIVATCNYTWRQKLTNTNGPNSTTVCGAACRKYLDHNRLVVGWQLDDILNQNIGLSRSINGTQIAETTSNMLGRHWLLTLSYQFPKSKK
jgi:hypothetical protein